MKNCLVILFACVCYSQGATITTERSVNSYDNVPIEQSFDYPNIEDNVIDDEIEVIQRLFPPKPDATDYFSYKKLKQNKDSNPYVMDEVAQVIKLQSPDGSRAEVISEDEVRKAAAEVKELLETSEVTTEIPETTTEEVYNTTAKSAEPTFYDNGGSVTEESEDDAPATTVSGNGEGNESILTKFVSSIWGMVKASVTFAGNLFSSLFFEKDPSSHEPQAMENSGVTNPNVAIFAVEEPSEPHRFPSEEFEKTGRDVDSLGYGIA